ncbi:MAG TPA: hypothetical protein VMW51_04635 [Terriglobia bacterium]|nr:hypothetical protein [Terriglobia bacterium]
MKQFLKRVWPEEEAQDLSEYALLLFLVALTAITIIGNLTTTINKAYSGANTQVTATTQGSGLSSGSTISATQAGHQSPIEDKDKDKQDRH